MAQKKSNKKLIDNIEQNQETEAIKAIPDNVPETETEGAGNTKSNDAAPKKFRKWTWTWNNYSEDELREMEQFCEETCLYTFQEETGEKGTQHLQGYWEFKNARSFEALTKLWPKIHLEKCRNPKASEAYCRKLETRSGRVFTNIIHEDEVEDDFDYNQTQVWQQQILEIIKTKPHPRTIHWYWEKDGGCGKSTLCRSILIRHKKNCLAAGGKGNDIKFAVATHVNDYGKTALKTCLFDFERSLEGHISWSGIEQVKNGCFFSGKYESTSVVFNKPHVICFANHPPDLTKLSMDRWNIVEITAELKRRVNDIKIEPETKIVDLKIKEESSPELTKANNNVSIDQTINTNEPDLYEKDPYVKSILEILNEH